jgi:isoamylase
MSALVLLWPGSPFPLGASYDGTGTNFAVFSEIADQVDLCLFDGEGGEQVIPLPERTAQVWHGYAPAVGPGQRYGFRAHGPFDPDGGLRAHPSKLLLDPYATAVEGEVRWDQALFTYRHDDPGGPVNDEDSGSRLPKAVVTSPFFDWDNDRPPRTPWSETIVYEVHVKGFTQRHPEIPEGMRGTYAGLGHPAAIEYLTGLGVTAVELLPVHQFIHDSHLIERGLRNYWGYNSIGFLAPHNDYSASGQTGGQVQEFKQMVKALHEAGLEVILDVVYNHTAEGNHLGPTLSFKGLDNRAYYRVVEEEPAFYYDTTGTGNSLNMRTPHVLQLIMDSLRYWVTEMHVDGFRFDLASALARQFHEVDRLSAFFDLIQQDPVVSRVKLIAEPWDIGEGGYQVGNFPALWSEWNGKYRDCIRDFWRGEDQTLAEFASRIAGSSDLYQGDGRHPSASINFITAHDGFTLADLTAYNDKHNEPNGEGGADGESHNRSWNCGAEGPTDDPEVNDLRARQRRNLLTTLLLSQGIPMLLGGDEVARTQDGNNNAYCQDSEISWYDWERQDDDLLAFTQRVIALRKENPVFHRRRFSTAREMRWYRPDGQRMTDEDWDANTKTVALALDGDAITEPDVRGERITGDSFLLIFNAHDEDVNFDLPDPKGEWVPVLDTAQGSIDSASPVAGEKVDVQARSTVIFRDLAS